MLSMSELICQITLLFFTSQNVIRKAWSEKRPETFYEPYFSGLTTNNSSISIKSVFTLMILDLSIRYIELIMSLS